MAILKIYKWEVVEQSDKPEYEHILKEPYAWDKRDYKILYKGIDNEK